MALNTQKNSTIPLTPANALILIAGFVLVLFGVGIGRYLSTKAIMVLLGLPFFTFIFCLSIIIIVRLVIKQIKP